MKTPAATDVFGYQIELYKRLDELEKQNAERLDALKDLDTRIMPEERKYDEWGYCRIHKDILYEFDAIVKQAIDKAEGGE